MIVTSAAGAVGTISSVDLRHHHPYLMARAGDCNERSELDRINRTALNSEIRPAAALIGYRMTGAMPAVKPTKAGACA